MSVTIVFHTSLDVKDLEPRLNEITTRHKELFKNAFSFSRARQSKALDTEILKDEGVEFHSVSKFSITLLGYKSNCRTTDAVALLKKEFSDVKFIAMHQNETLM